MASNSTQASTHTNQGKRASHSGHPGGNQSLLLEKTKAGIRRSTPDSEALASSDDEQEQHQQLHPMASQNTSRSTRRPSWLSEVQQNPQRKGSMTGSSTFSPASSNPNTPAADQPSWVSGMGSTIGLAANRGHASSASFPWGSTIWNNDSQKGPPSRLTEVLPSPTTQVPPGSAGYYGDEPLMSPSISRDQDSAIPFAIPLHPTPKTYRSQSYSVGQTDGEPMGGFSSTINPTTFSARARVGSSYGLQQRLPRPSMLGEFPHDNSVLEQLREVDDDDESSNASGAGVQLSESQARTVEELVKENAYLRQAAGKKHGSRLSESKFQNYANPNTLGAHYNAQALLQQIDGRDNEERAYTQMEADEANFGQVNSQYPTASRRFSDFSANVGSQIPNAGIAENRKIESIKKGHWQSSLGFGGLADIPQSRRHSFAEVPTRHGSISSIGEPQNSLMSSRESNQILDDPRSHLGYGESLGHPNTGDNGEYTHFLSPRRQEELRLEREHLHDRNIAVSYFSKPALRSPDLYRSSISPSNQQTYALPNQYTRPQHTGHGQPHPGQMLCIVTFKACRAEVYYVQEGTGLQVKTGDLVIVEADRGTDLGTVAYQNISWADAKGLKEQFVEEHYKWLMMFSRHGQNGTPTPNPNSATNNGQHGGHGGMGLPGQASNQDPQNVELKPKMIKRLAQTHEIQTLRDKEANEAKAKRVCQQKVIEHRLNMEILDAEFQMDWKKLTFYYFADSYINFNSLVTDLFKIYKTRIWMSAINPASFVTPTSGLQLTSGLGPGAMTTDRDHILDSHLRKEAPSFSPTGLSQTGFDQVWGPGLDIGIPSTMMPAAYAQYYNQHTLENQQIPPNLAEYARNVRQAGRPESPFGYQGSTGLRSQTSGYLKTDLRTVASRQTYANNGTDWTKAMHALSLGN